ncbi:MAG: murein hydrolase activator EnvC family protein [Acidimicrobiales bacterium]
MFHLAVLTIVVTGLIGPGPDRAFTCVGGHRPPTSAPITDPFRPPAQPWLPGNRGLEYGTEPGDPVTASHQGTVVFAGAIGRHQYVTIAHGCDLVTTYSFLGQRLVDAGAPVARGQLVGRAGTTRFHFGARLDGHYIDPDLLFSHRLERTVRLVA